MTTHSERTISFPLEETARRLNRSSGLYLSESQIRGLAAGMFIGAVAVFAGLAWSASRVYRGSRR